MATLRLLVAEIGYRKLNSLLSVLAIALAVAMLIAAPTLLAGYRAQTAQLEQEMHQQAQAELERLEDDVRKTMLRLGFNLRIVHRDTDLSEFYSDFVAVDMPQEYVERLIQSPQVTKIAHVVATVQQRIRWEERTRLLVGFAPAVQRTHPIARSPLAFYIEPGTVYLGHETGIGRKAGDEVEILGESFRVARILEPRDSRDDIMIAMELGDAQRLLNKQGKITEIFAIDCKCETVDRLAEVRQQIAAILPDVKVTEWQSRAVVRAESREQARRHHEQAKKQMVAERGRREQLLAATAGVAIPAVVLAAAAWIGLLTWINIRERRTEIGLLRALGKGSGQIAALLLGKAALVGLVGGAAGSVAGWLVAQALAQSLFRISGAELAPSPDLLLTGVLGAPLVAAMASYLPTLWGMLQDPAAVLRDA